jgi:hypothetical protein
MLMTLDPKAELWREHDVMDTDVVRSFTDERVLNEFGKAMFAHSHGYYDFTDRMEVLQAEALRRMGESKSSVNA